VLLPLPLSVLLLLLSMLAALMDQALAATSPDAMALKAIRGALRAGQESEMLCLRIPPVFQHAFIEGVTRK
jgi:hypothetical protein